LIDKYLDTAPSNWTDLLLNERSNQTQSSLACSYYTHACSLDISYFDQEILDIKSYFFYKFFEDQSDCFKLNYNAASDADAARVSGQWHEVDRKDLQTSTGFRDPSDDFAQLGFRLGEAAQFEFTEADSEAVAASKETPGPAGISSGSRLFMNRTPRGWICWC
jgi:hypothetical protein